jgi:nitrite reductase/ring-hydroxylating ferredoxin subunit
MSIEKKYKWHKLGEPGEFLVAEGIVIDMAIPDKHFCITQINGQYYAFQSKCPHSGAPMCDGYIHAGIVECPLHRFKFNVVTGVNTSGEGFGLMRYPIKENEYGIWIGV